MKGNSSSLLSRMFRSPASLCAILACLGSLSVWIAIAQGGLPLSWKKILVGGGFGLTIGLINMLEMKSRKGATLKRVIGGVIGIVFSISAALLLGFAGTQLVAACLGGFAFGLTARDWISHITFV